MACQPFVERRALTEIIEIYARANKWNRALVKPPYRPIQPGFLIQKGGKECPLTLQENAALVNVTLYRNVHNLS